MVSWGKKLGAREKNEKWERKKEENYIKKGEQEQEQDTSSENAC